MYYSQHLSNPSCSLNLCVHFTVLMYNYLCEVSFNKYVNKGKLLLGKLLSFGYDALLHFFPLEKKYSALVLL